MSERQSCVITIVAALGIGCSGVPVGEILPPPPDREPPPRTAPGTELDATCANALDDAFNETLAVPTDVVAEGDDGTARITWVGPGQWDYPFDEATGRVEGYRVCWGPSTTELIHAVLVDSVNPVAQLRGVENGASYVAIVQAVDPDGGVSRPSEVVTFSGDPSRVDALRSEMTGFFDDFNLSMGPLDELRWSVAVIGGDPSVSYTYVGDQQHALSMIGNQSYLPGSDPRGGRGQNVARPRAIFDFANREGRIVFDMDGSEGDGSRVTWYVDVFPYEGEASLIDTTAHVTFAPGPGYPGRFLRFSQGGGRLVIHQHDAHGDPIHEVESFDYPFEPGVMRHVELRVAQNYAAMYVDGEMVIENREIDLDFERAFLQWSIFAYNPIKDHYRWQQVQWDNFGFDGPHTPVRTQSYRASFNGDDLLYSNCCSQSGDLSIEIPDSLEGALRARLMFSINAHIYDWDAGDHLEINGNRIPIPEPVTDTGHTTDEFMDGITLGSDDAAFQANFEVPLDVLVRGTNVIHLEAVNTSAYNTHFEVDFDPSANPDFFQNPSAYFTQPSAYITRPLREGVEWEVPGVPRLTPIGPRTNINAVDGGWDHFVTDGLPPEDVTSWTQPLVGEVPIEVCASNWHEQVANGQNLGIARIDLVVDDHVYASLATGGTVPAPEINDGPPVDHQPHHCNAVLMLDTTLIPNGDHRLQAIAYDSAGSPTYEPYRDDPALHIRIAN